MQLRRMMAGVVAGALAAWVAAPDALGETKVPAGAELRAKVQKLYGDTNLDDNVAKTQLWSEITAIMAKAAGKDRRNTALKSPQFWVEALQEARFTGKLRQSAKTKSVLEDAIKWTAPDGKQLEAKFAYYGPATYSPKVAAPLLVTFLDKGADAKAWINTTWLPHEDFKKSWVILAVPATDVFDLEKNPVLFVYTLVKAFDLYNVDPNRVYIEAAGSTAAAVQKTLSLMASDRVAGVLLRNPQTSVMTENTAMFSTAVLIGPEGAEKAKAVADAYTKVDAVRNAVVTAPDVASVQGPCAPAAEWLRGHKGRTAPAAYSFTTTFTTDGLFGEVWTGSMYLQSPAVRGQPTKLKVAYLRDSNTIDIQAENLGEFEVFMNDDLLDLDKEVAVFVNGVQTAKRTFDRTAESMFKIADQMGEYGRFFPASYLGAAPTAAASPAKSDKPADGGPAPDGGEKK